MPLEIPFLHDSNDNNFPEYYIPTSCKEQSYLYIYIYIEDELKLIERGVEAIFEDQVLLRRKRKILAARVACIRQQKRRLTADRLSELFPCKLGEGPLGTPSALERRSPIRFILSRNVYSYTVVHLRVPFTWIRRKRIFSNAKY